MKLAIDLGSRSVKIAIFDSGVYDFSIVDTSEFFRQYGKPSPKGFILDFEKFGLETDSPILATGYGRNALNIASAVVVPEIQAHGYGAIEQTGLDKMAIIDLGGQDSKIIWIDRGKIRDFYMNDRCAASAGRFIENMATVLGFTLSEIGGFYDSPESLNSTCAVFGESEIVAKLAQGVDKTQLAAGVNLQVVKKLLPRLSANPIDKIVLVGGVALNLAVANFFAQQTGYDIIIPKYPQFNSVIGLISLSGA